MERKNYKFSNGIEAHQEELSVEQDYKIAELFAELEISKFDDIREMNIQDMIKLLAGSNIVERFLEIILIPAGSSGWISSEKLRTLKNSEVKEVIHDFFTLNLLLSGLLQNLSSALATQTKSPKSSYSAKNAEDLKRDF